MESIRFDFLDSSFACLRGKMKASRRKVGQQYNIYRYWKGARGKLFKWHPDGTLILCESGWLLTGTFQPWKDEIVAMVEGTY